MHLIGNIKRYPESLYLLPPRLSIFPGLFLSFLCTESLVCMCVNEHCNTFYRSSNFYLSKKTQAGTLVKLFILPQFESKLLSCSIKHTTLSSDHVCSHILHFSCSIINTVFLLLNLKNIYHSFP